MKTGVVAAASVGISLLMTHNLHSADLTLFVTGAARDAFNELKPRFEQATGHTTKAQFDLPPNFYRRIEAGEPFDAIILSTDVAPLINQGKVVADSRTPLGRTGVGIAIAEGKRKPDFSTVDAFKRELLDAKAIATSGEGSSGRYVLTLLDRLGIGSEVKPKIKSGAAGDASQLIARGEVDFAVIGLPPIVGVPGVVWLGYLPAEIQSWLVFTAGISTAAKEPAAARALLSFLVTPAALAVWKAKGLEPVQ